MDSMMSFESSVRTMRLLARGFEFHVHFDKRAVDMHVGPLKAIRQTTFRRKHFYQNELHIQQVVFRRTDKEGS